MYWMNVNTGNVLESEIEPMGEWIEIDQDEFESLAHPLTLTRREHDAAQQLRAVDAAPASVTEK